MSYVPPKWPIPSDVRWIEVNGYPMAYQDNGVGVPIVLVHGSFFDYRLWSYQLEAFSKKHRVLNVSLRHYFPELWMVLEAIFQSPNTRMMWAHSFNSWLLVRSTCWVILAAVQL